MIANFRSKGSLQGLQELPLLIDFDYKAVEELFKLYNEPDDQGPWSR